MPKPGPRSSSLYCRRRRWTPDDAKEVLEAQAASGLSLGAFAIGEGLDPQRLLRWRRRLASSVDVPVFEEVARLEPAAPSDGPPAVATHPQRFEIVTATGRVVRVPEAFDAGTLRRILAIVDEVGAC